MLNYSVDIVNETNKAKSKYLKLALLFSLILTLTIVADILLIVLANEEYLVNLIIAVVITVLFTWFAIYFFFNIYNKVNARYRYFKGYESGMKSTDEIVFLKKSDELCYVNGLYVYPLFVKYVSNLNEQEKIIYSLTNNWDLSNGDKLTICTYQRILMKAEAHQ